MRALLSLMSVLALLAAGCGGGTPTVVRGEEEPGLDEAAFSTGLDKRDLDKMLQDNLHKMQGSRAFAEWRAASEQPIVSVLPIRNETTEHIDSALSALLSDVETWLVQSNLVRVVSIETQPELLAEIRAQQSDAYDQQHVAQWGKQLGAQYVVTGKVFTTDEIAAEQRRVQYYLFMQVMSVSTGEILYQGRTTVTKGIITK